METETETDSPKKIQEAIGNFCIYLFAVIIACMMQGFVFMLLWRWFVVPKLGWGDLGLLGSIGVCLLVQIVVPHQFKSQKLTINAFLISVFFYGITLLFGFLVSLFI